MSKRVLALAGCIAATAPTTSFANLLPESLVGLSLGEVRSSSFLNQPFKGVIPFLFTNLDNVKDLEVNLAPEYIFNQIGAEKHPILNQLNFQVAEQNNKAVILISSAVPIRLPFLNFVLEIQGPEGALYQDYTVLLDPASKQTITKEVDHVVFDQSTINGLNVAPKSLLKEQGSLLIANLSTINVSSTKQKLKYRVKTGDSLSKIAQKHKGNNVSTKNLSRLIFQKNPKAFVRGNLNRIKKGALLNLPTKSEINGFEFVRQESEIISKNSDQKVKTKNQLVKKSATNTKSQLASETSKYKVAKGDSLSKITKMFVTKDISFTKMMNAIYLENQGAFVNKSKNKLMAGVELNIPSFDKNESIPKSDSVDQLANNEKEFVVDPDTMAIKMAESIPEKIDFATSEGLSADQYRIKEGDTLSLIVKTIGYKEVPFAKMLKAIYANNPDSFIEGSMTNLLVGSVITLPASDNLNVTSIKKSEVEGLKKTAISKKLEPVKTTLVSNTKNVSSNDLVKRIRELRKELKQTKSKLSALKSNLSQKEHLLQQKNIQIEALEATLTVFNKDSMPKLMPVSAVTVLKEVIEPKPEKNDSYNPKSDAEILKLKQDLLQKQEKTEKQIAKIKELKTQILSPTKIAENTITEGLFKKYSESSLVSFTKTNYIYLSMALILSLLLIRYRRELYSYTYSSITYDQPSYYPIPDADKLVLKEKNINFHDPKMDEDPANYDFLTEDPAEPTVIINPLLVEAKQELFSDIEESKEIEHCEHLVTELFDDLADGDEAEDDAEWNDIEQVCDTYIEKIKDEDTAMTATENGVLVEEAADFNHMMADLLESLDKVDKSVKRNNISDDAFPDLVASSQAALAKAKKANLSFPPPKS